jgi:hypothetical protein
MRYICYHKVARMIKAKYVRNEESLATRGVWELI